MKLIRVNCKDGKLLGSAPTLEKITKLISEYYFGSTITLKPVDNITWDVYNLKGKRDSVVVINKGGRYRFEERD